MSCDNDFYEYPIKIVITDRAMAPPCTPQFECHDHDDCMLCKKEARLREIIHQNWKNEPINEFTSDSEIKLVDDNYAKLNRSTSSLSDNGFEITRVSTSLLSYNTKQFI